MNSFQTEDLLKMINYKDSGFHTSKNVTLVTPMHTTSLPILKIHWEEGYVVLENQYKKLKVSLDVETIKTEIKNFN